MNIGGWIFVGGLVVIAVIGLQLWLKGAVDTTKAKSILTDDATVVKTAGTGVVAFFKKLFSRSKA